MGDKLFDQNKGPGSQRISGNQGFFDNAQGRQGQCNQRSSGNQGFFNNAQNGQNLFANAPVWQNFNLFSSSQGGQGLLGLHWSKQPIKELTEKEKELYRMVSALPGPRPGQLLWQETKKNKIFRHLSFHSRSPLSYKVNEKRIVYFQDRNPAKRIYKVHRRKDIIKDNYSFMKFVTKSSDIASKYFREVEVDTNSGGEKLLTDWIKIFHTADFSNVKTLKLEMVSWCRPKELNEELLLTRKSLFPNLENLKVIVRHKLKDLPIQNWTLNLVQRLHKLRNLHIEFSECKFVGDKHLNIISKTLQSHLDSLESLSLILYCANKDITPKAIQNLWESINKIPNLKKLEIAGNFSQNKINEEAFATLCNVINRKSATLQVLKIDVSLSEHVKSNSHQHFSKVLANILPRLLTVELIFISCNSLNDESMAAFGELLSNGSPSLKNLELELSSQNITDKGAKEFAERMKKGSFPQMQKLSIDFQKTNKLTYDGLYGIAEAIPEAFPNLKNLGLLKTDEKDDKDEDDDDEDEDDKLEIIQNLSTKAAQFLMERLPNLSEGFGLGWRSY